eukprot:6185808-Pleurochrysis_carterae.AAC.3
MQLRELPLRTLMRKRSRLKTSCQMGPAFGSLHPSVASQNCPAPTSEAMFAPIRTLTCGRTRSAETGGIVATLDHTVKKEKATIKTEKEKCAG